MIEKIDASKLTAEYGNTDLLWDKINEVIDYLNEQDQ